MTSITGLYKPLLPDDVAENVARSRSFSEMVADLGRQQARMIADIEEFEKRFEAWGARIEEINHG